jgi:uncharacterized protein (TIGR02996 family)
MTSTLEALHRAVTADPTDRTVRLVYADALDETGLPADVARAEFIRGQIKLETAPKPDGRLAARCGVLFEERWLEWWRPVCEAAEWPEPYVRGKRARKGRPRPLRRPRPMPENWPYTRAAANTTVQVADRGMSVRFAGGFPEEVRFLALDVPENAPEVVHRWGDAMPLVHLALASHVSAEQWREVAGPHLARLPELTLDWLLPETAAFVAETPHLAALTRLTVNPIGANADAVRSLVAAPPWAGLRSLRLTGQLSPNAVQDLASHCRLGQLEELDLAFGGAGDIGGLVAGFLGELLRRFTHLAAFSTSAGPRWQNYGPALEALAAAPWVRRLRRLRLSTGESLGLLRFLGGRLQTAQEASDDVIPDSSLRVLADALGGGPLERLELPTAVVSRAARRELDEQLGGRVAFG